MCNACSIFNPLAGHGSLEQLTEERLSLDTGAQTQFNESSTSAQLQSLGISAVPDSNISLLNTTKGNYALGDGDSTTKDVITIAFSDYNPSSTSIMQSSTFNATQIAQMEKALTYIESVINVDFQIVDYNATTNDAVVPYLGVNFDYYSATPSTNNAPANIVITAYDESTNTAGFGTSLKRSSLGKILI